MKKISLALLLSLVVFANASCSHKKTKIEEGEGTATNTGKAGEGLEGQILWLKNNKKSIEMNVQLTNHYTFPVSYEESSLHMTFEDAVGELKKNKLQGEIDADHDEKGTVSFTFDPPVKKLGKVTFTLDPIYGKDKQKLPALKLEVITK